MNSWRFDSGRRALDEGGLDCGLVGWAAFVCVLDRLLARCLRFITLGLLGGGGGVQLSDSEPLLERLDAPPVKFVSGLVERERCLGVGIL